MDQWAGSVPEHLAPRGQQKLGLVQAGGDATLKRFRVEGAREQPTERRLCAFALAGLPLHRPPNPKLPRECVFVPSMRISQGDRNRIGYSSSAPGSPLGFPRSSQRRSVRSMEESPVNPVSKPQPASHLQGSSPYLWRVAKLADDAVSLRQQRSTRSGPAGAIHYRPAMSQAVLIDLSAGLALAPDALAKAHNRSSGPRGTGSSRHQQRRVPHFRRVTPCQSQEWRQ